ncbi:nuclear transport factor 2 family protein [Muricauda sp. CAU 1633]|uniref:nuclear transport factor 2 family protein n=1 Tax=Allomuricauda sp. CAU 1633 TaxID=2816036 RepID=UPI001A90AFC9|nr:nuclear transport factor 2 family protein [Muricauda sp. CAU 1633]MBO0323015.1 nuclear transport factor 2 family protein [Muricauda sp. CAU 1633]
MISIKIFKNILAVLVIGLAVSCTSQGAGTLDQQSVLEALGELDQALIDRDSETLSSITASNLTYGHSSGNIQDKQEFIDDVMNGPFRFVSITNEDQSVAISGNTGIVRHILSADATNAGNPAKVRIGIVMVFQQNENGKVVLLARQAYKL